MKVATVLISFIPVFASLYILWHVHTRVPSMRLRFAKTRGYLSIASMFAVTTIYWVLVIVAPADFGMSYIEGFSGLIFCVYLLNLLYTIVAFGAYISNRPISKSEGRAMAGW